MRSARAALGRVGLLAMALLWSATLTPEVLAKGRAAPKAHKAQTQGKAEAAQSIGPPNAGRLVGGARLKKSPALQPRDRSHSWGLPELVGLLRRAADKVARKHRGAILLVGDLSARSGGPLVGHNSHQSGRDADVGFYAVSAKGKSARLSRFMAFGADGRPREGGDALRFDDARNWAFVEALLSDKKVAVRYVFISNALRARLLSYAAAKGVSKELLTQAAAAMMSPAHAEAHDDHFHVRMSCPTSMRGPCVEESIARGPASAADSGLGIAVIESGGADPMAPVAPAP
jgi:penicillin-insensitive murein endopeptidase